MRFTGNSNVNSVIQHDSKQCSSGVRIQNLLGTNPFFFFYPTIQLHHTKHSNRFNTDLVTNDSKYSARVDCLQGSVMDPDCLRPVSQEVQDSVAVLCLVKVQRVYWLGATMNSTRTLSVGKVERGPTVYIMTATKVLFSL